MIQFLWERLTEVKSYLQGNYHLFWDSLDILIVAMAIYWLLLLIRGTRAVQMAIGLMVLIFARLVSDWAQLATVGLILDQFFLWGVLIIIVLFQHDIRRALTRVGRGVFPAVSRGQETLLLEEIVRAAQALAQRRKGALVVLERDTNVDDLVESGVSLDAKISKELLISIFQHPSPLHDGAVLIQRGRVSRAGCVLPLTLRVDLPDGLGTRHRAALGLAEQSDAVVVVVSEETGTISVVMGGDMIRDLDAPHLRAILMELLAGSSEGLGDAAEAAGATEPGESVAADPAPSRS